MLLRQLRRDRTVLVLVPVAACRLARFGLPRAVRLYMVCVGCGRGDARPEAVVLVGLRGLLCVKVVTTTLIAPAETAEGRCTIPMLVFGVSAVQMPGEFAIAVVKCVRVGGLIGVEPPQAGKGVGLEGREIPRRIKEKTHGFIILVSQISQRLLCSCVCLWLGVPQTEHNNHAGSLTPARCER